MNVNGYETKAAAMRALKAAGFNMAGLLAAPESNPKVAKNGKLGVMTAPLHLAPAKISGFETCPQRSEGCTKACLHTAGNPAYMAQKFASRNAKTQAYFTQRKAFMAVLAFEIAALQRKAKAANMECGVRLNATSDIAWERVALVIDGQQVASLMDAFPEVQFYDYTKVTKRALLAARGDRWPSNYHITFSKTESNDADCIAVLEAGGNVAAVASLDLYKVALKAGNLPYPYHGPRVVDGDEHDFRPADPDRRGHVRGGVVVLLKAKGDAKRDTSGFVLR